MSTLLSKSEHATNSGTLNTQLLTRSAASIWHPCTQMKHLETLPLLPIARGQGVWLYDFQDQRYLDAISSWWVNLFGHAHPYINAALIDQLQKLEHVMLAGCTHQPAVELAERLSALTAHQLGHCFFASDGASAVEIALKMSFHFWRNSGQPEKSTFINLTNSYHGETLGALSVTDVTLFRDAYQPLLRRNVQVPSPDSRLANAEETPAAFAARCAEALEQHLIKHHAETAALIVEPLVQGACGMAMYHADYLRLARALCDRYGVHLIADEIMTGCGRTGTFFAHEQAGIVPDMICLSKGITGGYLPLSLVMTTDKIYQAFYDDSLAQGFLHSHSYTGNALACRAALAALDIFEQDNVLAINRNKAAYMTRALQALAHHQRIKNFRSIGMIWAMDVDNADAEFGRRFYQAALERGVLLRPIGSTLYLMPPYVISEDEMDFLATAMHDALDASLTA